MLVSFVFASFLKLTTSISLSFFLNCFINILFYNNANSNKKIFILQVISIVSLFSLLFICIIYIYIFPVAVRKKRNLIFTSFVNEASRKRKLIRSRSSLHSQVLLSNLSVCVYAYYLLLVTFRNRIGTKEKKAKDFRVMQPCGIIRIDMVFFFFIQKFEDYSNSPKFFDIISQRNKEYLEKKKSKQSILVQFSQMQMLIFIVSLYIKLYYVKNQTNKQ